MASVLHVFNFEIFRNFDTFMVQRFSPKTVHQSTNIDIRMCKMASSKTFQ